MPQNSVKSSVGRREIGLQRARVASRVCQLYGCLAHLSSPSWKGARQIPSEAAIEIQHALAHLVFSNTDSREQQSRRLRQATAHLDRAVIDFLKTFSLVKVHDFPRDRALLETWLKTRLVEYHEHASSEQSPEGSEDLEVELITIQKYLSLTGLNLDTQLIDFSPDDLKGEKWQAYSVELDNWLASDLVLGCLTREKAIKNLHILLNTFWNLDTEKLLEYNNIIHWRTLKIVSKLGIVFHWPGDLWGKIESSLPSTKVPGSKEIVRPLYVSFLKYFDINPWRAVKN